MVVAIVVLFLVQIPSSWITRAGLTLQLISIFMLSPHLLGTQRLEWVRARAASIFFTVAQTSSTASGFGLLVGSAVRSPIRSSVEYVALGWLSTWLALSISRVIFSTLGSTHAPDHLFARLLWAFFIYSNAELVLLFLIFTSSSIYMAYIEKTDPEIYAARVRASGGPDTGCGIFLISLAALPSHFLIGLSNLLVAYPALVVSRLSATAGAAIQDRTALSRLSLKGGIMLIVLGTVLQIIAA